MSDGFSSKESLITLEEARELVELLEVGMIDEADAKLMSIYRQSEQDVFLEVGALTRGLHDAINDFVHDARLKAITDVEMPDASERLHYIIEMTDKAATRTLDAVDACAPKADELINSIENLMPMWSKLMHGDIDRYEFVKLCHDIDDILLITKKNALELSSQLTEILMAQDYQDLTGQMLQKVIGLVGEVEDKLVSFLKHVAPLTNKLDGETNTEDTQNVDIEAQGPALNRQKEANIVASSQDEVDDLLASLGF